MIVIYTINFILLAHGEKDHEHEEKQRTFKVPEFRVPSKKLSTIYVV